MTRVCCLFFDSQCRHRPTLTISSYRGHNWNLPVCYVLPETWAFMISVPSCVAVCLVANFLCFTHSPAVTKHIIVSNTPTLYWCRYYRRYYWCMSDWIHANCSSVEVNTLMESIRRSNAPFTSRYYCPIVSTTSTPGSALFIDAV